MIPKPGEVLYVDRRASVQFAGDRALIFRVTAVPNWTTYQGWIWLRGYVLTPSGEAVAQREIFVQLAGLRRIPARQRVIAAGGQPNSTPPAAYRPAPDRGTPVGRFRA